MPGPPDRPWHWIRANQLNRSPHRWCALDTEAVRTPTATGEEQTLALAVATRWRDDLKREREPEWLTTGDPIELWEWVGAWTKPGARTVCWCHNLAYDLRIADAFRVLPGLGWRVTWLNLTDGVTTMRLTRDGAGLVLTDLHSWLPTSLEVVATDLGTTKLPLPPPGEASGRLEARCRRDVEVTAAAARELTTYVRTENLGNWQPSGAGMAWTAWRHRFMPERVLVHPDQGALTAEREASLTGRCEAWRWGQPLPGTWHEWDVELAYARIAHQIDLPARWRMHVPAPTRAQYEKAKRIMTVLARATVTQDMPVLGCRHDGRILWPVGTFTTTAWDRELDLAEAHDATISLHEMWCYVAGPIMRDLMGWIMDRIGDQDAATGPLVRRWLKHSSRAVIGRTGVMARDWQVWGPARPGDPPYALVTRPADGGVGSLLTIGDDLLVETSRHEAENSCPQVMSRVMSEQRARLWEAMHRVGLDHVAYCDTDGIWVDDAGHERMLALAAAEPDLGWRRKRSTSRLEVIGPRKVIAGHRHQVAGVPGRARRTGDREWTGEVWESVVGALAAGRADRVVITDRRWRVSGDDPRRRHLPGGRTAAVRLPGVAPA